MSRPTTALANLLGGVFPRRLLSEIHVEADAVMETAANYLLPWRVARLRKAQSLRGLKVNIGCGAHLHADWINVDYRSERADLRIDVRRGLPFAEGGCHYIFCEHVFEHLDKEELKKVLSECHRVLEPGGAIRIVMPDLESAIRVYREDDRQWIRAVWEQDMSPTEALNQLFYQVTHHFIHDFGSLRDALRGAGFSEVYRCSQGESRFPGLNIDSNAVHRRLDSLYVEAVR